VCDKGKGKVITLLYLKLSTTPLRRIGEWRYSSTPLTSALDGGEWSASNNNVGGWWQR